MDIRWATLAIIAMVLVSVQLSDSETLNIIAVVDERYPEYEDNLQTAVRYLNKNVTNGHQFALRVVQSSENDMYTVVDAVCGNMQQGAVAILDLSSRYVTAVMRSLSEAMGIFHMSAVDPSYEATDRSFNLSLNIHPPASVMLHVIRDIVSRENLTNIGIIYDKSFDLTRKPKKLLRNIAAQHLYMKMATNSTEISEQLSKIKSAELTHMFLAGTAANTERFLAQANKQDMMTFRFNWYAITKDMTLLCSECKKPGTFVVATARVSKPYVEKYLHHQKMVDSNFDIGKIEVAAAFQFDIIHMLGKTVLSMIAGGEFSQVNYSSCQQINTPDPQAYQQALVLKENIRTSSYEGTYGPITWEDHSATPIMILDIRQHDLRDGNTVTKIGNWTMANRVTAFRGSISNQNVQKRYRVITTEEPPFIFKTKKLPANKDELTYYYYNKTSGYYYYGYCIELIHEIGNRMKFKFDLYEPPDGRYGTMQADGSWDGLINELIQDRADIAVAPLSVMAERENVIDFTVPYYDLVGITILMKKPKFQYSLLKFMSVLETPVWACVFTAFLIVSVLLALFDKWSPYSYQNNRDSWDGQGEEPRIFTIKEGLWFCMTSLTPQGGGEAPRALSGRLVAATWWMFGFIMIATYTANLAAFLTVSRLDQPIESLDDLAKQFKTKYAPQASTSTETYFRRMADIEEKFYTIWKAMSLNDSLDPVERAKLAVWDYPVSDKFTNMWVSMEESGFPQTLEEAIKRIKFPPPNEDFAFIGDATRNKFARATDCDLWEVGEEFSRKPYALAVQEGSPLKNDISSEILQLLNLRRLEDLKTKWWEWDRKKCDKIEDESDGISIYNIGGVFLVIFIGIGLGLSTLAFEYYWYNIRPQGKGNDDKQPTPQQEGQANKGFDSAPQNNH